MPVRPHTQSVSPARHRRGSDPTWAASATATGENGASFPQISPTYKMKGNKLVFVNQRTGDSTMGGNHSLSRSNKTKSSFGDTTGVSEYRAGFASPPFCKAQPKRSPNPPVVNQSWAADHFETTTSRDYVPFKLADGPPALMRPVVRAPTLSTFEGTSTHRAMFTAKPWCKRALWKYTTPTRPDVHPMKDIASVSHADYPDHTPALQQIRKDRAAIVASGKQHQSEVIETKPFNAKSVSQATYVRLPGDAKSPMCKPDSPVPDFAEHFPHKSEYGLNFS